MKKYKFKQESKEFKKYWDLLNDNKLSDKHVDGLIKLYKKYRSARNKCTAAILLSHIDNDDRIPPIIFGVLKYWDDSGYGGWVVTTNARLFNYYPKYRKQYLDLMFNGFSTERDILANSLFFFQDKLREISYKEINSLLIKFARQEKSKQTKKSVLLKLNKINLSDFCYNLLVELDPLGLIKLGGRDNVYYTTAINLHIIFVDKNKLIKRIKYIFKIHFNKIPKNDIVLKIADRIIKEEKRQMKIK